MKKFLETIANIWKIEELKNKILITLGLLLVYRFGAQVTLPGIDATKLQALSDQTDQGIGWLINVFTGGDRKSTRLNSSHVRISYAVFCLKKKNKTSNQDT